MKNYKQVTKIYNSLFLNLYRLSCVSRDPFQSVALRVDVQRFMSRMNDLCQNFHDSVVARYECHNDNDDGGDLPF